MVGSGAGNKHQQGERQELDEADEAGEQGLVGKFVDVPDHRDRQDLRPEGREHSRQEIEDKGSVSEGCKPSTRAPLCVLGGFGGCVSHCGSGTRSGEGGSEIAVWGMMSCHWRRRMRLWQGAATRSLGLIKGERNVPT